MTNSHHAFAPRRVVIGNTESGRSTVIADSPSETRSVTPMWTINDMWQTAIIPPKCEDEHTLVPGEPILYPEMGGVNWRVTMFPPDSEWHGGTGFSEGMGALGAAGSVSGDGDEWPGMHTTETLDIGVVVSGEMTVVLEETEVVVRPGDAVVMRGNKHAWSNRTDQPSIVTFTMIPAER